MRKYGCLTLGLLLLTMAGGCPVTQSQNTPHSHVSGKNEITGSNYLLYVPSTYDKSKPVPLVITCHGTPPWDTHWLQIREWKYLAEKKGFIVVAPQLRCTQGILPVIESIWLKDLEKDEKTILEIKDELCKKYNINEKAILLTGFSAGGYPMYYTGLRNPDQFNMLLARACNADKRIFERIDLTDKTRRIPVWLFVGKDDLSPIQKQTWMAYAWLRRNGWNKYNCKRKNVRGGHLRRPETAYNMWVPFMGK